MFEPFSLTAAVGVLLLALLFALPPRRGNRPAADVATRAVDLPVSRTRPHAWAMWRVGRQRSGTAPSAPSTATTAADAGSVRIDRATAADIPAIRRIAEQWQIGERSESDLKDRGFLVSDFGVEDYEHLVSASDYCFLARRDGHPVGFLLAYSQQALREIDDATAEWVGTRIDDFVVIKQVAVDRDQVGSGIGGDLYMHLISHLRGHGTRLVAAVVDTPPNIRSHAFHRRLGFTEAFSLRHADGRTRRIWLYSTVVAPDEVLAAQYDAAVRLYMHEDTLNWDKLRNYLYVTVMIAAAVGFLMGQSADSADYEPATIGIALSIVGLATSLGFGVSLRSGVAYLAMRKETVAELESMYLNRDGVRVVSRLYQARPWLRRSPTTWFLGLMPVAGAVMWLLVLVYLVTLLARA